MRTSAQFGLEGAIHPRKVERTSIRLGVGLRKRGLPGTSVALLDLSTHGARVETHTEHVVGSPIWLKLPGLEGWDARVAWVRGAEIGCEFTRPLHPAVVDRITKAGRR